MCNTAIHYLVDMSVNTTWKQNLLAWSNGAPFRLFGPSVELINRHQTCRFQQVPSERSVHRSFCWWSIGKHLLSWPSLYKAGLQFDIIKHRGNRQHKTWGVQWWMARTLWANPSNDDSLPARSRIINIWQLIYLDWLGVVTIVLELHGKGHR